MNSPARVNTSSPKAKCFLLLLLSLYMGITLRLSLPSLNNPTKEKLLSGVPLGGFQIQSVYCTEETGS